MDERPILSRSLDSRTFRDFYYLKEELVKFCRDNGFPSSGGKMEITERIACFLETGKVMPAAARKKRTAAESAISEDSRIEADFVCSERHRAFFRKVLGDSFRFNVPFQKWLKDNAGKTYRKPSDAGNTKNSSKGTTATKGATLQHFSSTRKLSMRVKAMNLTPNYNTTTKIKTNQFRFQSKYLFV